MRRWVLLGLTFMLLTACAPARRAPDTMLDYQTMVDYLDYIGLTAPPDPSSNSACAEPINMLLIISDGVHMGICCADGLVWSYRLNSGWYRPTEEEVVIWNRALAVGMHNPCK